jgi:hypothetical protein
MAPLWYTQTSMAVVAGCMGVKQFDAVTIESAAVFQAKMVKRSKAALQSAARALGVSDAGTCAELAAQVTQGLRHVQSSVRSTPPPKAAPPASAYAPRRAASNSTTTSAVSARSTASTVSNASNVSKASARAPAWVNDDKLQLIGGKFMPKTLEDPASLTKVLMNRTVAELRTMCAALSIAVPDGTKDVVAKVVVDQVRAK